MKKAIYACYLVSIFILGCSKEDEKPAEVKINHTGEKWQITSVSYTIVDQQFTKPSQSIKTGTLANAGAFYFNGSTGSFDITIGDIHKEDVFSAQINGIDVTIVSINQTVGVSSFSQHVIALSGDQTSTTTMTLQGTVTKQSTTAQFVLTGTFELLKE